MSDARNRRVRSIKARVTTVAIVSAACGGLLASGIAIAAVDRLIAGQLDQRLKAATFTLADELDEEKSYDATKLRETLDDENAEIASSGIRLSVLQGTTVIAGDAGAAPTGTECESHGPLGKRVRVCSRPYGQWLLVARQPSDVLFLAWMYLVAAIAATALGAAVGGLISRRLSSWTVGSLTELERAIEQSAPEAAQLPPPPTPDASEVGAVRAALERQMQRSQELLQQSRRFASNAAHELRTPLATLRTELELLAEDNAHNADVDVLLRSCRRVEHLSSLIERLLVLTVPVEHARRGFETVSLNEVVEAALERLDAQQRNQVALASAGDVVVRGDWSLLAILVDNGIGNALKFAPHDVVRVTVSASVTASRACIIIEDSGPGVDRELRANVFEPFFRAASGAQGHGLGLALVAHVARLHDGQARFEDTAVGARLVVELPLWKPEPGPVTAYA